MGRVTLVHKGYTFIYVKNEENHITKVYCPRHELMAKHIFKHVKVANNEDHLKIMLDEAIDDYEIED